MAIACRTFVTLEWTRIVMDSAHMLLHVRVGLKGSVTSRTNKLFSSDCGDGTSSGWSGNITRGSNCGGNFWGSRDSAVKHGCGHLWQRNRDLTVSGIEE